MKKIKSTCLFVVLASILLSFTSSEEWKIFETKQYEVLFPGKPTSQVKSVKTEIGEISMDIHMFDASKTGNDDNLVYGFITSDYPSDLVDHSNKELISNLFRSSIDGAVNNVKGTLLSETDIEINGHPGRAFKVDFNKGFAIINMRMYLVKNTMVMLQTITLTEKQANTSIDKFMNSFKLKK
jgi:hypothetical protein